MTALLSAGRTFVVVDRLTVDLPSLHPRDDEDVAHTITDALAATFLQCRIMSGSRFTQVQSHCPQVECMTRNRRPCD